MTVELKDTSQQIIQSPYSRFLYALNSPETKKKYSKRFEVFLNFINIDGATLEERLYNFYQRAKSDADWLQDSLIQFIMLQKEKAAKGEIA